SCGGREVSRGRNAATDMACGEIGPWRRIGAGTDCNREKRIAHLDNLLTAHPLTILDIEVTVLRIARSRAKREAGAPPISSEIRQGRRCPRNCKRRANVRHTSLGAPAPGKTGPR